MAKDPAFLFYPEHFNTGTQFFTDEQVGKYMRLLMAQHQHGHLTEEQVIFICKSYDKLVMSKFLKDSKGLWYNERLENEIVKRKNFTESRSKNRIGKKNISKSHDVDMVNVNIDINSISNTIEDNSYYSRRDPHGNFWSVAFDEITLEQIKQSWSGVDIEDELKKFKSHAAINESYEGRDVSGMRSAFLYQLRKYSKVKRNSVDDIRL